MLFSLHICMCARACVCVCFFLPVPNPARVTVRTLAIDGLTVVTIFTRRTHFLAVFTKKALGADLITPSPIPSSLTCNTASSCHFTGLLAFAVPTPGGSQ